MTARDWKTLEEFYDEISNDVYKQPDESGRIDITKSIVASAPLGDFSSILDVGCGYGYAQSLFPEKEYIGITSSESEQISAVNMGRAVFKMDYNFIGFGREFDLVLSSHSLEHSPFPVLTLMEWHRVGKSLLLIVPNPDHYGYIGKNHYSVAPPQQVRWWLRRAGWMVVWKYIIPTDMAYFAIRKPRIGVEGWASMDHDVYVADRDDKMVDEVKKEREESGR